ncbi:slowpoke-binding protein-like [Lingula anatina]|uniref:Slowpoke-binding protein-like n=1 Tax=Lingula anatina TaxID=7574 RepID=A0A1S3J1W4_LINAN|nr:slowpoke-binding protein-like [Lingula anatina]|eukprot:XP_013404415.1 slowpoke-binding protein-like [Lingula anatina]
MGEFENFIKSNVWVVVVVGIVLVVIIILVVYCICKCRHNARYDYTALHEDIALPAKLELESKQRQNAVREAALLNCQYYLRSLGQYVLVDQMEDIGSRVGKHWFLIKDVQSRTEKVLSMVPKPHAMPMFFTAANKKTLSEVMTAIQIQHPFIFPLHDIDFVFEQDLIVAIHPYSNKGSLKDLIYKTRCSEAYVSKYNFRSSGLPLQQLQTFGKQILEALLFLSEKGFPSHGHVHSGNVFIQNSVCRLAGYENAFLGLESKLEPILKKKLRDSRDSIDSLCFGHLFYEMSRGFELDTAFPEARHLIKLTPHVAEVLNYIFHSETIPSIQEINQWSFFSPVILPALKLYNPVPIHFTSNMKALLKSVKKGKLSSKKLKRKSSSEAEQPPYSKPGLPFV